MMSAAEAAALVNGRVSGGDVRFAAVSSRLARDDHGDARTFEADGYVERSA